MENRKKTDAEIGAKVRESSKKRYLKFVEKNKESLKCECGGKYKLFTIKSHLKTKKHTLYLSVLNKNKELEELKKELNELKEGKKMDIVPVGAELSSLEDKK